MKVVQAGGSPGIAIHEWGARMKKTYEVVARVFRWLVGGMVVFIVALPILAALEAD
jgi:hypothetical protein